MSKVWVQKRSNKGKDTYRLRWQDESTGKWKSKSCGSDRKLADREAATLESELDRGTHRDIRKLTWQEFTDEYLDTLTGWHRNEARYTLEAFGKHTDNRAPKDIRHTHVVGYLASLKDKGNDVATRNKRLRYLKGAFNTAVEMDVLAVNPAAKVKQQKQQQKVIRVLEALEEPKLLKAAENVGGDLLRALVMTAINTGGRRAELLELTWDRVILDKTAKHSEPCVIYANTKSRKLRTVPLGKVEADTLRKLKAKTLQDGGPFASLTLNRLREWWTAVRDQSGIADLTLHDLRRTFATSLIRAGVALPHVQELCGHASIQTTLSYYNQVNTEDCVAAMRKYWKWRKAR